MEWRILKRWSKTNLKNKLCTRARRPCTVIRDTYINNLSLGIVWYIKKENGILILKKKNQFYASHTTCSSFHTVPLSLLPNVIIFFRYFSTLFYNLCSLFYTSLRLLFFHFTFTISSSYFMFNTIFFFIQEDPLLLPLSFSSCEK